MRKIFCFSLFFSFFSLNGQVGIRPIEKMEALFFLMENFYVEEVDMQEMAEHGLRSILKELDPHSYFMSAKEVQESDEQLGGNFEGIGIQFNIHHDTILVVSPISGGPSEKAGIRSGDRIVTINDTLVAGKKITNSDVFRWLRGAKGTEVILGIQRRGEKSLISYKIIRDKIPVYSVDAVYMAAPGVGYIKINRFSSTTVNEFKEGLAKLKEQGCENLILDLSDNSGGYLHAAVDLADEFLSSGELIVYTEGLRSERKNYNATFKGGFLNGRIVVIINEGSASASEIVSGAIQDLDRGLVVGRRSFGKGLVQNSFPLPDGSAIRLTTSRYYTPSGRFIQAPYDGGTEKYFEDLYSRFQNGELSSPEKINFPDSLMFRTRNNRVVYGGGGIMPDYFIPIDTTFFTGFLTEVSRKNLLNETILNYVEFRRETLLQSYPSLPEFAAKYDASAEIWSSFLAEVSKAEIEVSEEDMAKSKDWLASRLKGLLAQNLFTRDGFFMVVNQTDPSFMKALELITSTWPKGFGAKPGKN
jgi:carboxyl-terminal processing protease